MDFTPTYNYLKSEFARLHINTLIKAGIDMSDYLVELRDDYKIYMKMYKILFNKRKLRDKVMEQMESISLKYDIITEEFIKQ